MRYSFSEKIEDIARFQRFYRVLVISVAIGAFTDLFDSIIIGADSDDIEASKGIGTAAFGSLATESFIGGIPGGDISWHLRR